jgi:hypothetical protein
MANLNEAELGVLIFKENPYYGQPYTPGNFAAPNPVKVNGMDPDDLQVEKQADLGTWIFKGTPHYIERALRIAYTYTDANGVTIKEYLLIGYAGGGAY